MMSGALGCWSEAMEWAVAGWALDEVESGDLHFVSRRARGWLLAVIDGLGHGPPAAEAAREAVRLIEAHVDAPLAELIQRCHAGLRQTRGVVMTLAALDEPAALVEWVGVGNVEAVLVHSEARSGPARTGLISSGGVLGCRLPAIRPRSVPLRPGDLVLMATDGVRAEFADRVDAGMECQLLADALFGEYAKGTDDALILVARYRGLLP